MRSRMFWPVGSVAVLLVSALTPLIFNSRYYFVNDTEAGAFPQWYEIGDRVLSGNWSLLNTDVWQSGNYQAEGAWGLYSPFLWLIGLGSHVLADGAVYSTIVKLLCLAIAGAGLFLAARTYGVPQSWAAVVTVAAPLAGFTMYFDAPSWVNGLMAWCFWPWALALTRRTVFQRRSPLPAILACLLLVGIGYVSATLFLAATIGAILVEATLRRDRREILRGLGVAVIAGLFTIVVHLPGLLTSPATNRQARGISNDGFLTADVNDLLAGVIPTGGPFIDYYDGVFPGAPITYIAWFIPLLAFIDLPRLAGLLKTRTSLVILLVMAVLAVMAPGQIGPLRYPVRLLPYVAATVVLVIALGLARARVEYIGRRHVGWAAALVVLSAGFMFAANPDAFRATGIGTLITLLLVFVVWMLVRTRRSEPAGDRRRLSRESIVAGAMIVACVTVVIPQHVFSPRSPLGSWSLPSSLSEYGTQVAESQGDVLMAGSPGPSAFSEALLGNAWYLTGKPVQNAYTSVYYPGYTAKVCSNFIGTTCGALYQNLFERMPETRARLVDLLGVSTIVAVKDVADASAYTVSPDVLDPVPEGWHTVRDTPLTRMIVRDEPVHGAGGVVWSSSGTEVELVSETPMATSFRVDAVPSGGGTVALALIDWPGYEVTGGTLTDDPVDGLNLGVRLDESAIGSVVTVRYWSPGWQAQLLAGIGIILISAVWSVLVLRSSRRRRRSPELSRRAGPAEPSDDVIVEGAHAN